jgi:hypothetical protein
MVKSSFVAGTVICIVLLLFATGVAFSQQGRESSGRWQYAEVRLSGKSSSPRQPNDPVLNRYGADGWELVNVVAACASDSWCEWYAYFKRRN